MNAQLMKVSVYHYKAKRTKFREAIGEQVSIGGFSKMEYLLICSILQSLTGIGNKYAVLMLVMYQPCTTTFLS